MQHTTWRHYPILQDSKVFDYSASVLQGVDKIENNREREVEMLHLAVVKSRDCFVCVCACVCTHVHERVSIAVCAMHLCDLVLSLSWSEFTTVERFMGCYKTLFV